MSGPPQRQDRWLAEAARVLESYPLVRMAVYFNAPNAANNRLPVQPDWGVEAGAFERFAGALKSAGRPSRQIGPRAGE